MPKFEHIDLLIRRYPVLAPCESSIERAVSRIVGAYESGRKLLICGNGGSSADADHIVGELMKGFCRRRPLPSELVEKLRSQGERGDCLAGQLQQPLRAINLSQHPALNSAFANDVDPALCFAQQALGYTDSGDVLLGISTSGNSKNIVDAAIVAKAQGADIIALTGEGGGKLRELADILIDVPCGETYMIQELHLPVYHALCLAVEAHFFAE